MDDIREMKPGRELDALVAEKVMGWAAVMDVVGGKKMGIIEGNIFSTHSSEWLDVPHYSTDISAAFEVLKNFYFHIENMGYGEKRYQVILKMHRDSGEFYDVEVFAESLPEAICKAAIIAKEDKT